ncbi:MAG: ATP-binding cassette domain-containing protein, partial [Coriobacteriaceae bacterium]|nr:ATP-binding cassette domain-containing protein [Coriobacteriaceae bacterium]
DATDEEIVRAARAARCHEFIMALPQGYDTDAGEAGGRLSGGERQRITLARAILKPASFVVLDEATAYADPESEAQIQEALTEVVRGRSLIVVAHRLNTVRGASKIVVMDKGRVAAQGTHDQLIRESPLYRTLWRRFNGEEL